MRFELFEMLRYICSKTAALSEFYTQLPQMTMDETIRLYILLKRSETHAEENIAARD